MYPGFFKLCVNREINMWENKRLNKFAVTFKGFLFFISSYWYKYKHLFVYLLKNLV